jgi:hypothetical protein
VVAVVHQHLVGRRESSLDVVDNGSVVVRVVETIYDGE